MTKKLEGYIQTGLLFIGDPGYMAGEVKPGEDELVKDDNPFYNWDRFTDYIGAEDYNLPFTGGFSDEASGRGLVIQTNRLSGKYELQKEFDEQGKLLAVRVIFHD